MFVRHFCVCCISNMILLVGSNSFPSLLSVVRIFIMLIFKLFYLGSLMSCLMLKDTDKRSSEACHLSSLIYNVLFVSRFLLLPLCLFVHSFIDNYVSCHVLLCLFRSSSILISGNRNENSAKTCARKHIVDESL